MDGIDHNVVNLLNTIALLGIAFLTYRTHSLTKETKDVAVKTEVNTNSMREALVKSTAVASHAEGKVEGLAEAAVKAATLAEGQLAAQKQKE